MRRNKEAGQVLFTTAAALVVLIGIAGLAVDVGVLRYEKRVQQSAADAAAIAGAEEIPVSGSLILAGQAASAQNGFADSGTGQVSTCTASGAAVGTICVQVDNPPQTGPHASCSSPCNYVEALVSKVHPTYFMKIFGRDTATVTARAVATMVSNAGGTNGCVYTLGPQGTGIGVTNSGTPQVTAPTCAIYDDGDWTTHGKPVNIQAGAIGIVGTDTNSGGGTVNPTPVTVAPVSDPLSYLTPPCTSCSGGSALNISSNTVVSPGTYSSISITGGTVNFQPGTYIITGNFTVNGNATVCSSTNNNCSGMSSNPPTSVNAGVTFYMTGGGGVTMNGTANVYLSAPTSGSYTGILFYQDPSDCSAATLNGTNTSFYQGALYFPGDPNAGCNVQLNFGGTLTNTSAAYTVIVTDDLKFFGTSNVTINSNYSSLPGGVFPAKNAVLVE